MNKKSKTGETYQERDLKILQKKIKSKNIIYANMWKPR